MSRIASALVAFFNCLARVFVTMAGVGASARRLERAPSAAVLLVASDAASLVALRRDRVRVRLRSTAGRVRRSALRRTGVGWRARGVLARDSGLFAGSALCRRCDWTGLAGRRASGSGVADDPHRSHGRHLRCERSNQLPSATMRGLSSCILTPSFLGIAHAPEPEEWLHARPANGLAVQLHEMLGWRRIEVRRQSC